MSSRRFVISTAICIAAIYAAYYEQAGYDPAAEAAKARAVYENMARGDAAEAYRRCKEASPDEPCSRTHSETLQRARSYYGQHGGAYNVVNDTQTRNLYLFVAAVSGFVAFSQLRRRKQQRNGANSSTPTPGPVIAHTPISYSSHDEGGDAKQDATIRFGAAEALADARPATNGPERGNLLTRPLKSLTAFPNLLFGALFFVNLMAASQKGNAWGALGVALGVCLIPLALGVAWNATKGEARTLKWAYVGASSLLGLIFVAAQIQDTKEGRSQATPSAVAAPEVAPTTTFRPVAPDTRSSDIGIRLRVYAAQYPIPKPDPGDETRVTDVNVEGSTLTFRYELTPNGRQRARAGLLLLPDELVEHMAAIMCSDPVRRELLSEGAHLRATLSGLQKLDLVATVSTPQACGATVATARTPPAEVPQSNTTRPRRSSAITTEDTRPKTASITGIPPAPVVPGKRAHSYQDFSSMAALGTLDEVRDSLDSGANVNERTRGTVPLIAAARHGRSEIVALLLARGAQVNAGDSAGNTAMYYARMSADADTIEILSQWGATNPFGK